MAKKEKKLISKKKEAAHKSFFVLHKWAIMIFAFAMLLYVNSIPNNYNLDDELVTNNHRLTSHGISAISDIFRSSYYKDESGYSYEYRPVVLSSFAIEHEFFGDNPHISHFINVFLYSLCCVLLFKVLTLLMGENSLFFAFAITIIFIAHPAHTEVVASIKNRDEILSLIFSLLSVYMAFKANRGSRWLFPFLPFLFSLALMSKLTAVSFIFIIPSIIILFTNTGFLQLMITSLLLVIPSFFLINNVGTLFDRIILQIEFIFIIIILYIIYHIQVIYRILQNSVKYLLSSVVRVSKQDTNYNDSKNRWTELFIGINPDRSYYSFRIISPAIFACLIYAAGLFTAHVSLIFVGCAMLFAFILLGSEQLAYWTNATIYICLLLALSKYPSFFSTGYGDIVSILLVYQALFGDRKLFIPSLILSAIFITLSILWYPIILFRFISTALMLRLRNGWILCILFWVISLVDFYNGFQWGNWHFFDINSDFYFDKFSLILVTAALFRRNLKFMAWTYKLTAFVLLLFYIGNNPIADAFLVNGQVKTTIVNFGNHRSADILPKEQDRPLLYLEQPVTNKDPWQLRAGTSLEILLAYLHKVVLPYPMAFYYGYKFIQPEKITDTIPIISLILYSFLAILTIVSIYKHKAIALGLIIYLVATAAISNYFIPVPGQIGERFLLIPSLGWAIILTAILFRIFNIKTEQEFNWSSLKPMARYIFAGIILLYSTLTFSRNLCWKDDLTLFRHDITYVNQSAQAHNLLGLHLMKKYVMLDERAGHAELAIEALSHFKQSYHIYPHFFNVAFDIARVSAILNQTDSAIFYFNQAIKIDSSNGDSYVNVGKLLISEQKFSDAIPYLEHVTKYSPLNYGGYENLSYAFFSLGEYQKSIEVNKTANRLLPAFTGSLVNIARTFYTLNKLDSAQFYVQKALEINPNDPVANKFLREVQNGRKIN